MKVMKFWGDDGGSELMAKNAFFKMSLVQKGDFIKARGQDPWAGGAGLDWLYTMDLAR